MDDTRTGLTNGRRGARRGTKRRTAPPEVVVADSDDSDGDSPGAGAGAGTGAESADTPAMSMSNNIKHLCHESQNTLPRAVLSLGGLMATKGSDPMRLIAARANDPTAVVPGLSALGVTTDGTDLAYKMTPAPPTDRGGAEAVIATIMAAMNAAPVASQVDVDSVAAASTVRMTYEADSACLCIPPPRFLVASSEVVVPSCVWGSRCVVRTAPIRGMPPRQDLELMAYMTPEELTVAHTVGAVPANIATRPCVLCMRSCQTQIIKRLQSSNALTQLHPAAAGCRVVVCAMVNAVGPGQYNPDKCISPSTHSAVTDYVVPASFKELFVSAEPPIAVWPNCTNAGGMLWIRQDGLRQPVDGRTPDMLPPDATIANLPSPAAEARKAGAPFAAHMPMSQVAAVVGKRHASEGAPDASPLGVAVAGVPPTAAVGGHPTATTVAAKPLPPFGAAVGRGAPPYSGGGAVPAAFQATPTVAALAASVGVAVPDAAENVRLADARPSVFAGDDATGEADAARFKARHTDAVPEWDGVDVTRRVPGAARPSTEGDGGGSGSGSDSDGFPFGNDDGDDDDGVDAPPPRNLAVGEGDNRRRMASTPPVAKGTPLAISAAAAPADF